MLRRRNPPTSRMQLLRAESLILILLAAVGFTACAASGTGGPAASGEHDQPAAAPIETLASLALPGERSQLALEAVVVVSLWPLDPVTLEVLAQRPAGQTGDHGLLELEVRWRDFEGVSPTSFGGSERYVVPLGADGVATPDAPFVRSFSFALPAPEARVLARKLSVKGRLHPVDLRVGSRGTGGYPLTLQPAEFTSLRRDPAHPLVLALADDAVDPAEVFLAGLAGAPEGQALNARLSELVQALPDLTGARREAVFGALHGLTGQTEGRSVYRWRTWLERRLAAAPAL